MLAACTAPLEVESFPEVADAALLAEGAAVMPGTLAPPPAPETDPELRPAPEGPAAMPRIVVSDLDPELDVYTAMECPFAVHVEGTPAIAADGSTVLRVRTDFSAGGQGEYERLYLDWNGVTVKTPSSVDELYDAWAITEALEEDPYACAKFHRQIQRTAETVNAKLAAQSWRSLPALDVYLPDEDNEYAGYAFEAPDALDAKTRPVEVFWADGQIIARVRKVKLFFNESAPWFNEGGNYEPDEDEAFDIDAYNPCEYEPVLSMVHGDAATGLLMVTYDHDRPETSCMCDGHEDVAFLTAPPAFFEHVARRPLIERNED